MVAVAAENACDSRGGRLFAGGVGAAATRYGGVAAILILVLVLVFPPSGRGRGRILFGLG